MHQLHRPTEGALRAFTATIITPGRCDRISLLAESSADATRRACDLVDALPMRVTITPFQRDAECDDERWWQAPCAEFDATEARAINNGAAQ